MKIFNIPIKTHWSYWILILFIFYYFKSLSKSFYISAILSFSILCHELGHAFMAIYLGYKVEKIFFFLLGAGTEIISNKKINNNDQAIISAAGPIVNFILSSIGCFIYILILYFHILNNFFDFYLLSFWITNLFLGIFNLIPIYPMDGRKILEFTLGKVFSDVIARRVTAYLDFGSSIALILVGVFFKKIEIVIAGFFILIPLLFRKYKHLGKGVGL